MIRAVLGGTFDPVHAGHVAMARHVLANGLADVVHVIPNWQSPWREAPSAGPADRLAMCRLAFATVPGTLVDPREIDGGRPAWTVDTLADLAQAHPADRLRLVVGADHLPGFERWREPARILELAEFVVLDRPGAPAYDPPDWLAGRLVSAPPFDHPVSASAVRAMLAGAVDPQDALPAGVAAYIAEHGLYRAV